MKPSILLTIAIISSFVMADLNAYAATPAMSQSTTNSSNNQWVEIGEVTMVTYNYRKKDTAVLYAFYIGNRILYKVDYGGKMYTVSKNDYPTSSLSNNSKNACIIVDGEAYYLDVPSW